MKLVPGRGVVSFVLRFVCLAIALRLAWPYVALEYARAASALGNLLAPPTAAARLEFSALDDAEAPATGFNVLLTVSPTTGGSFSIPIDLRTLAYLPTSAFLAVALATPIWRTRRALWLLLAGTLLINVFIVVSIGGPLLLFFNNPAPLRLVELSDVTAWLYNVLYRALVVPPGMAYAVPALLWLSLLWVAPPSAARAERQLN